MPAGKHALISVKQPRGQLVAVRASPATQAQPSPRELRLWQDCDVVQVRKTFIHLILVKVVLYFKVEIVSDDFYLRHSCN